MGENPKKACGDAKPSIHCTPTQPLLEVAEVMANGAEKYGRFNWRKNPIQASTYVSAIFRHFSAWADGEDFDRDSHKHHLAHIIACCLIVMDARYHAVMIDDRRE